MIEYAVGDSSTIYMDGSGLFHIRRADRPGILATLRMWPEDAKKLAELLRDQGAKS
jgi:hypothetical protein